MKYCVLLITLFMFFFVWLVGAHLYYFLSDNGYKKFAKEKYEIYLGDTVIVNNNTYIITDFDTTNCNVKLDNGSTIYIGEVDKYLKK